MMNQDQVHSSDESDCKSGPDSKSEDESGNESSD